MSLPPPDSRIRRAPFLAEDFLQEPGEIIELPAGVRHVFDRVALVGDQLDVEAMLVLEHRKHIVEGIVEPRVALGDQQAGAGGPRVPAASRPEPCSCRQSARPRAGLTVDASAVSARCSIVCSASLRPSARALLIPLDGRRSFSPLRAPARGIQPTTELDGHQLLNSARDCRL